MDRVKIKHIWLIILSVETSDRQPEIHALPCASFRNSQVNI